MSSALGSPPAGVDAAAMINERAESTHSMVQQLAHAATPHRLPNGAPIRWLGPKVLPTMDFETGSILQLVSVELVIPKGMSDLPTLRAATADYAERAVARAAKSARAADRVPSTERAANATTEAPNHLYATTDTPNLFGADEALVREIRSLEDQLAEMPRSLCVSREGAWPWRHEGHYCTSAAGALDSLAVTAALALPAGASLVEPAFTIAASNQNGGGVVMVLALLQCPADADPHQAASALFSAAAACTGACGVAGAAYANLFTHPITRRGADASSIHSTVWGGCRKGANMFFGGLSELVNNRFGVYDSDEDEYESLDDAT